MHAYCITHSKAENASVLTVNAIVIEQPVVWTISDVRFASCTSNIVQKYATKRWPEGTTANSHTIIEAQASAHDPRIHIIPFNIADSIPRSTVEHLDEAAVSSVAVEDSLWQVGNFYSNYRPKESCYDQGISNGLTISACLAIWVDVACSTWHGVWEWWKYIEINFQSITSYLHILL